jgi:prephenate dehydratase
VTGLPAVPRYGYLGPEGTFCEAALLAHLAGADQPDAVRVPCVTVGAALDAVRSGEVDAAMVPVENSVAVSYTHLTLPTN